MTAPYHSTALLFVDGIGLTGAGPDNPLSGRWMPALGRRLGADLTVERVGTKGEWALESLDACLGVDGLPQSATGQATLFTGVNAAAAMGRHVPALPGPRLRALIEQHSVFAKLAAEGRRITFANAFTAGYLERLRTERVKASATTWSILAAGLPLRVEDDLEAGRSVTWDVEGDLFRQRAGGEAIVVDAVTAGQRLAAIAREHDLTLFETFLTDLAGHGRWGISPSDSLRRLDGLIEGLISAGEGKVTVALVSDHGNLEESGHRRHTRNPVPWLVHGPLGRDLLGLKSIADVAPRLLDVLG